MPDPNELHASHGPSEKSASRRSSSQRDFEIEFFERVLRRDPSYVDVLRILGQELTERGLHLRGLQIDQRLVRLRPNDPVARYNLACSYALLHQNGLAVEALRKAIELGYEDRDHLESDSDLDNLRNDPEYQRLLHEHGWE
jgi:tetratricopeptide (TPR) repeat protein